MKVKQYLRLIKERYGVSIRLTKKGVLALDKRRVPATVLGAMAGYRAQLKRVLRTGEDEVLDLTRSREELESLGFQVLDDAPGEPLCHPEGDEVGLEILVGVLGPNDAMVAAEARANRTARERAIFNSDRLRRTDGLTVVENTYRRTS